MFSNQIRQWVMENEDIWTYLILPADCKEQGWVGELEAWPRCTVLWIDALGLYYDKLSEMPVSVMEAFNPRNGLFQIDAMVTSRRATAVGTMRELWDPRLPKPVPMIIDESMTAEFGKTPSQVSDIELAAQTLGYGFGWPVFDTEEQLRTAQQAARRYLSGSMALKMLEKAVVIPCGFDPKRTEEIILADGPVVKNEKFTSFFGGRMNRGSKRIDIVLREMDSLFRFGRDMNIHVTSPKAEGWMLEFVEKEYPEIQILTDVPSEEFKRRMSKAHVFANFSASEGFSVGFAEAMYMTKFGTVLIAPRTYWTTGMMKDKYDEYPFLFEDFEQARVMLRWIFENHEEAVKKSSWLGDWAAEQYDMNVTNRRHLEHYRHVVEQECGPQMVRGLMGEGNRELTLQAFEKMPATFSLDGLYLKMKELSRAMKDDPRRGQTTKWAVRRWLINEGMAVDLYDAPEVNMRKSDGGGKA